MINNNNNYHEILFWKIFKNKYLNNLIFEHIAKHNENIDFLKIDRKKCHINNRIKMNRISHLEWLTKNGYNNNSNTYFNKTIINSSTTTTTPEIKSDLLKDKIKSGMKLRIDNGSIIEFLNSTHQDRDIIKVLFNSEINKTDFQMIDLVNQSVLSNNFNAVEYFTNNQIDNIDLPIYPSVFKNSFIKVLPPITPPNQPQLLSTSFEIIKHLYESLESKNNLLTSTGYIEIINNSINLILSTFNEIESNKSSTTTTHQTPSQIQIQSQHMELTRNKIIQFLIEKQDSQIIDLDLLLKFDNIDLKNQILNLISISKFKLNGTINQVSKILLDGIKNLNLNQLIYYIKLIKLINNTDSTPNEINEIILNDSVNNTEFEKIKNLKILLIKELKSPKSLILEFLKEYDQVIYNFQKTSGSSSSKDSSSSKENDEFIYQICEYTVSNFSINGLNFLLQYFKNNSSFFFNFRKFKFTLKDNNLDLIFQYEESSSTNSITMERIESFLKLYNQQKSISFPIKEILTNHYYKLLVDKEITIEKRKEILSDISEILKFNSSSDFLNNLNIFKKLFTNSTTSTTSTTKNDDDDNDNDDGVIPKIINIQKKLPNDKMKNTRISAEILGNEIFKSILNFDLKLLKSIYFDIIIYQYEHLLDYKSFNTKQINIFGNHHGEIKFNKPTTTTEEGSSNSSFKDFLEIIKFLSKFIFPNFSKHFFRNLLNFILLSKSEIFTSLEKEQIFKEIDESCYNKFKNQSIKLMIESLILSNFKVAKVILLKIDQSKPIQSNDEPMDTSNSSSDSSDSSSDSDDDSDGGGKSKRRKNNNYDFNSFSKDNFETHLGRDNPYKIIKKNLKKDFIIIENNGQQQQEQEEEHQVTSISISNDNEDNEDNSVIGEESYDIDSLVHSIYNYDEIYWFINQIIERVPLDLLNNFSFLFEHLFNLILQSKQVTLEKVDHLIKLYQINNIPVVHRFYQIFYYIVLKNRSFGHLIIETWDLEFYGYFRVDRYLKDSEFQFDQIYQSDADDDDFKLFLKLTNNFILVLKNILLDYNLENDQDNARTINDTYNENCLFLMEMNRIDYLFNYLIETSSIHFMSTDSLYYFIMKFDNIDKIELGIQFLLSNRKHDVSLIQLLEVAIEGSRIESIKYLLLNYIDKLLETPSSRKLTNYQIIFNSNYYLILSLFLSNSKYKSLLGLFENGHKIQYSKNKSFICIDGKYEKDLFNKAFSKGYLSICILMESHYGKDNGNHLHLCKKSIQKAISNNCIEILKWYYLNFSNYKNLIKSEILLLKEIDSKYYNWLN